MHRVYTLLLCAAAGLAAQSGTFTNYHSYPLPGSTDANGYPFSIVAGPDGALWYTRIECPVNCLSRITTGGTVTEYAVPGSFDITVGPDGALWTTDYAYSRIWRTTTAGATRSFPIPTPDSDPRGITVGPDGALWFAEYAGNIGRITTAGAITEYPLPSPPNEPGYLVTGSDGALWFTDEKANRIGRITTDGVVTQYPLPTAGSQPFRIVAGPDGALWFVEFANDKVGRITTAGVLTEYPIFNHGPVGITAGPDGALWVSEAGGVTRITVDGLITAYPAGATPDGITVGVSGGEKLGHFGG
jgi:virginiamycin B lyase